MQILVLFYVLLIIGLQVVPLGADASDTYSFGPLRADYLVHVLAFLPWLGLLCLRPGGGWRVVRTDVGLERGLMWLALGVGLAVGAEGIQCWLPYRGFNPMDMLSSCIGVVLGCGVLLVPASRRSS